MAIAEEEQLPVSVANFEQRSAQVGGGVADDGEIAISIFVAGRQVDVGDYERAVFIEDIQDLVLLVLISSNSANGRVGL